MVLLLLTSSLNVNAGINAVTYGSRANCLHNDSATWWLGHPNYYRLMSWHYPKHNSNYNSHFIDEGLSYTDIKKNIHYYEGNKLWPEGTWRVETYHYEYNPALGIETCTVLTNAYDCSQYDGWSDY